ncbi:MAG: SspB family protein [Hyphomicrobiales bacterium]
MAEDLMRYDLLAQDALRGVVRSALAQVARDDLPGEHHLFIALDTRHPDVQISDRLRQKYPEEITIVLQHQYWNLDVGETEFSVELTFDNVLEKLVVPFTAIKGFFDPAVQFGLQFETKPLPDSDAAESNADMAAEPPPAKTARQAGTASAGSKDAGAAEEPAEGDVRKVVSLDQFRKK